MDCSCCETEIGLARKVKIRLLPPRELGVEEPASAAHEFRWGFLCESCYGRLDNATATREIGGRAFNLAWPFRDGKAEVVNQAQHDALRLFER
jgi:hypothetical protein